MDFRLVLTTALIALLIFLVTLRAVKYLSHYFGAENTTYKHCAMVILLSLVITGLIDFVIISNLHNWWIALCFTVVLPSYIVTKTFGLSFLKGFLTAILSAMISLVLGSILVLVFIYSGLFSGLGVGLTAEVSTRSLTEMPRLITNFVDLTRLQVLAHRACQCIDDKQCIYRYMAKFEHGVSNLNLLHYTPYQHRQLNELQQIVQDCVITYQNIESRSQRWENAKDDGQLIGVEHKKKKQFKYRTVAIHDLGKFRDKIIIMELDDGHILKGRLLRVTPLYIKFREFTEEGYDEQRVHIKDIHLVKVRQ